MRKVSLEEPGRYHLRTEEDALLLDVHESVVPDADSPAMQGTEHRRKAMGIADGFVYTSPDSDRLGYGGTLEEVGNGAPGWTTFRGELPEISRGIGMTDHRRAYPLTTTLEVLLGHFRVTEHDSDSLVPQYQTLLALRNDREALGYGHMVHAEVLPPLVRWIHDNLGEGREEAVADAMREAHGRMSGGEDLYGPYDFRVALKPPKWIHMDVPGDACGLDPESGGFGGRDGETDGAYRLIPHNTDTPLQQLTLLYGLAKLEELAVEDYRQSLMERIARDFGLAVPARGDGLGIERPPAELLERVKADIEAGEYRTDIPCQEARKAWFEMARSVYLRGEPPKYPRDAEIGFHTAGCPTPECRSLLEAYAEVLRTSSEDDAEELAKFLDELETNVGG